MRCTKRAGGCARAACLLLVIAWGCGEAPPSETGGTRDPAPSASAPAPGSMAPDAAMAAPELDERRAERMARRGYEPRRTRLGPSMPALPAPSQAELEALLASADPDQREDAVYDLEPTGRGLQELAAIAREDPSPHVRRAAVAQAATGEGPRVSAVLIAALDDPDSDVIEEAINGLEMADAGGAIPHLRPLLDHADPGIRLHAEDAIAYLSE